MTVVGRIQRETATEAIAAWRRQRSEIAAIAFAPKSILTLSQWSDRFRYLSADLGEPGPWRTSRVPYLRRVMDAITDPRVRRVSVMKSARIGATQALVLNAIGYYIHQEPSPIIVGLPTVDDAQKFSAQLLRPAIEETPVLAERSEGQKGKKRRATMLQMNFPGAAVQIIGTVSPRAMRMVHGRIILKSEVDAWVGAAGSDGDPYRLIDRRADTYGNPKFIEESTPLVKETSRIEPAFQAGSAEYFLVPCPHCGEFQRLVWGGKEVDYGIKWGRKPNGEPDLEDVYYVCQPNGCEILETEKYRAVAAGRWQATHPDRVEHLSFHLNALLSPFEGARWPRLVKEFVDTKRRPEQVRVFVNTILGETYEEKGEQADQGILEERRDAGHAWWTAERPVPYGAAKLTLAVDTQDDRLEAMVVAWGAGEESWILRRFMIPGDPALPLDTEGSPWNVVDEELAEEYRHASGRSLGISATFIDAGGHRAKEVHAYARARRNRRVFAIFGSKTEKAPLLGTPKRNKRWGTVQYELGVFTGKETLLTRIEKIRSEGPGFIHVAPCIEDAALQELTAEKLVIRGDKRAFVKAGGARNESTDLWVYNLAALHQLGPRTLRQLGAIAKRLGVAAPDPDSGEEGPPAVVGAPPGPKPPVLPKPRRKSFVNSW